MLTLIEGPHLYASTDDTCVWRDQKQKGKHNSKHNTVKECGAEGPEPVRVLSPLLQGGNWLQEAQATRHTELGKRVVPRLRESRLLTPSGHGWR